ncbi:nucleoside hydrolase-like domain-containing protein [Bacteroidota bacterium]
MRNIGILLILLALFTSACGQTKHEKIRILILTDIENEPDDAQSMVRFLTYANMFDVEGLVATTSCWQRDKIADWRIHEIVDAYGIVRDNLEKHEKGYPAHAFLKERIKKGYPDFGMNAVGEGKDSEGSEWIIKIVDQDDPRPVWIPIWGGANCLAQALWKVKETRTREEIESFVSKLRVYTISDQDNAGPWMRKAFPELFYICSPGYRENGGNSYFYATWIGISGERNYHFPSGADKYIVDNEWVDENLQQNHGPLGAQYPDIEYIMEGDSPSFMYLLNNGLNVPEHPDLGSWGGRYAYYTPYNRKFFHIPESRPFWTNTDDWVNGNDGLVYINAQATIWRWREAYQNDFAARMDWTVMDYDEANHPPIPVLKHSEILKVKSGENVVLDASRSSDPDKDELSYEWIYYKEVGSFGDWIKIENNRQVKASFIAPVVEKEESIHIILAVTDKGEPALTRYKRVIVSVNP